MSPLSYRLIQSAAISTQKKQLHNQQFDDIYHHSEAVAESQFVFHEGNRLLSQWHDKANEPLFVIAETGFGSGLNFLTTRRLWQNCDNKPQHLHYISTEQWLLTPAQLLKAYQDFPDLQPDLVKIQQVFQLRRAGFHSYQIDKDITLHLLLGDACHCLQQLNAQVDAWFLDGFSPAKNPAMWSPDLFQQIARLSRPGGSFATFTAASQVRKNLQAAGFEVVKTTGFKGKRERLVGQFKTLINPEKDKQAWAPTPQATHPVDRITIIGGGVAGLCLAKMARQKGLNVTVIDRQAQPLAGASGNPFALMMPYLTAQYSPEALFYWRAFEAALRFYPKDIFKAIGVNEVKQQPRPDDARLGFADDLIQATKSGFYYPNSGRINTTALAPYLMAAVDTWLTAEVAYIDQNTQGQWLVQDSNRNTIDCSELLVVACGIHSVHLLPEFTPFISARSGQTELYQLPAWSQQLDQAQLNQSGYLVPCKDQQQVLIGGDYQHLKQSDWFRDFDNNSVDPQLNFKQWQNKHPYASLHKAQLLSTRIGIRAGSLDHLPLCGPLIDSQQFKRDYHDLHHGRHWQHYPPAQVRDNLYVLTALGSRGYTSAPLLAEYLMAMIRGQPLPLEQDLVKILHPNRFLYRQLKKAPL